MQQSFLQRGNLIPANALINNYVLFRLLDVLADRKAKRGLSGHVLINGRKQPHNFKCASAYVIQVS